MDLVQHRLAPESQFQNRRISYGGRVDDLFPDEVEELFRVSQGRFLRSERRRAFRFGHEATRQQISRAPHRKCNPTQNVGKDTERDT